MALSCFCLMAYALCTAVLADDPPANPAPADATSTNHKDGYSQDEARGLVVRFRVKPPPFAVERAGTVGVYPCLPDVASVHNVHGAPLKVKTTWKAPDHVPHLNQSLTAWKEFKGHGYFVNPENHSLVLVGLEVSDSGVYTCVVQGGGRRVEASMQLHVLYIPPYEFAQRALVGLLAMTLVGLVLGLLVAVKRFILPLYRNKRRRRALELGELEPSLEHA